MLLRKNIYHPLLSTSIITVIILFVVGSSQSLYSSDLNTIQASLKTSVTTLAGLSDNREIIEHIAQKKYVLIGDSTHGTHEFYQQRINITKSLIKEKNFKLIALEGDLPNVHRVNQYVQSLSSKTAMQVLNVSNPQGAWLWGNVSMLNFIQWLKEHNEQLPLGEQKVRLHGLDIYSFERSRNEVVDYLQLFSPEAAQQAIKRYSCFSRFGNNLHRYGKEILKSGLNNCAAAVNEQFELFVSCHYPCPENYPAIDREAYFYAQENAHIVKNTEKSFRIQYQTGSDITGWNQRDLHMMESFLSVSDYMEEPKSIFWLHNSHLGDARATEMVKSSQLNIGQLLNQSFSEDIYSIGMLTYQGLVSASDDWDSPAEIKKLLRAHPDSNEALFHSLGIPHFFLDLHQSESLKNFLNRTRLQRHVGVVYRPDDEMDSHYSETHLSDQFNAIIFIDTTTPVIDLNKSLVK